MRVFIGVFIVLEREFLRPTLLTVAKETNSLPGGQAKILFIDSMLNYKQYFLWTCGPLEGRMKPVVLES